MARNRGGGGRGGARTPARPAPVSNPQSGARTDGGAGSARQPIRPPTGGNYGDRKASVEQQGGAAMATAGGQPTPSGPGVAGGPGMGGGAGGGPVPGPGGAGAFGPTERPGESPLAGAQNRGQVAAQNADHALRVIYSAFPHPAIARLMKAAPEKRAMQ